ncbi:MAG: 30S ribosomal protein S17e [Fervidicoccaceae archaeon]
MGRVRTSSVKRLARQLLRDYPQLFTTDFEKNKEIVAKLLETNSKKLRNQVAGYVTHLVKLRAREIPPAAEAEEAAIEESAAT